MADVLVRVRIDRPGPAVMGVTNEGNWVVVDPLDSNSDARKALLRVLNRAYGQTWEPPVNEPEPPHFQAAQARSALEAFPGRILRVVNRDPPIGDKL